MGKTIIYLSTSCSKAKFNEIQEKGINRDVPQAQKYHRLLIEGMSKNQDCCVNAISLIPTNRTWCKKIIFSKEDERINQYLTYTYVPFVNIPVIKQLLLCRCIRAEIRKVIKNRKSKQIYLMCDIWNLTLANEARYAGRKFGIKTICIVTDVPKHRSNAYKSDKLDIKTVTKKFVENQTYKNAVKYDYYLLLTKAMNEIVNPYGKPYIVLEGHSDLNMRNVNNSLYKKKKPKVILYAGTLHREYGIEILVNAFIRGDFSEWELHVFGKGNYEKTMRKISDKYPSVKYYGLASNEQIITEQLEASIIVNPRPTVEDFVQYSFPSKTLEAMVSGTPLLTTKLPGMPDEYYEYIYTFEEENEEGYLRTLKDILKKTPQELHNKGIQAKQFAITKKNNVVQARKVLELIEKC